MKKKDSLLSEKEDLRIPVYYSLAVGIPVFFRSSICTVLPLCVSGFDDLSGRNGGRMDRQL